MTVLTDSELLFFFGKIFIPSVCLFVFFYLGNVIESPKELIEHCNQLFGRTGTGQLSESHNICVQDTTHTKEASALKISNRIHRPSQSRQNSFALRHYRADVAVTWRPCADGCRGCENCESWFLSSCRTRAWRVFLSLPFSAPQRCSVATRTGGAAPVTMDAARTRGGWEEILVARLSSLANRAEDLPTKVVHDIGNRPKALWGQAVFTHRILFHIFVYLLWILPVWDCLLFSCSLASDKWMINLLSQEPIAITAHSNQPQAV